MKQILRGCLIVLFFTSGLFAQEEFVTAKKGVILQTHYNYRPIRNYDSEKEHYGEYYLGLAYVWKERFSAGIRVGHVSRDDENTSYYGVAASITEPYASVRLLAAGDSVNYFNISADFALRSVSYLGGVIDESDDGIREVETRKLGLSVYKIVKLSNGFFAAPKASISWLNDSWQVGQDHTKAKRLQYEFALGFGFKLSSFLTLGIKPSMIFTNIKKQAEYRAGYGQKKAYILDLVFAIGPNRLLSR